MLGLLFSGLAGAGSRVALDLFGLAVWLLSRPGGWAVLVVLILVGLRWYPGAPAAVP